MTARPGDSFPTDLIFPPFAPRTAPQAPASPAAPQSSAPAAEPARVEEPVEQGWEAPRAAAQAEPLETADRGDFAAPAGEMPWDLPEAPGADDAAQEAAAEELPWLELPQESRAAESAAPEPWQSAADEALAEPETFSEPESFALPEADEAPGGFADTDAELGAEPQSAEAAPPVEETVPDWLAWDPGTATVTETPDFPPPGDVAAAASAREPEAVDPQALAGSLEGLESFDRSEVPVVEPVRGLAPVGDFDVPSEPPAAYETPTWAQPSAAWAAPTPPEPAAPAGAGFGASAMEDELAAELRGIADAAVLGAPDEADAGRQAPEPVYDQPPVAGIAGGSAAAPAVAASGAAQGDDRLSGMLGEVADRLESIARSLRERSPAEVLAGPRDGSADPLELLVTGFVLGYLQRGGGR